MDTKTLTTLEYSRILERLESFAAFSASQKLAHTLRPTNDYRLAVDRLTRTTEARRLLSEHAEISVGGARDIRPQVTLAARGGVLEIADFIDIKTTLESARDLGRFFSKQGQNFPQLCRIAAPLIPPVGLIEAISRVISEKGEIVDDASPQLASLRAQIRTAHDRLQHKLEQIISDPNITRFLQENIITQRNGRYVVPLRAEHKGRFKSVVQDQSASGSTLFVEPLAVVELNNALFELQLAEKEEIHRILTELSIKVKSAAGELNEIVNALAMVDLSLMCAKYAEDLDASAPIFHHPNELVNEQTKPILKLLKARHPLIDPQRVVPIDILLQDGVFSLVITGPNTGGKTVTLKTAGLLALMAQSGLHIPAQSGSEIMLFREVYADIGDEQSIEQSLSTFSGHITNIVRILKKARWNTLVLLDELGAGTDPQEGSALARAIMQNLIEKKVPCLVATHYPELKAFAHTRAGVMNASMEFDLVTLQPTYRLILGLPGKSNALAIAGRLGMEAEVIDSARSMLDPSELRTDDLLDEINKQREIARQEKESAEHENRLAQELKLEWQAKLEGIEEERMRILEKAQQETFEEIELVREELRDIRKQASAEKESTENRKQIQKRLDRLGETQRKLLEKNILSATQMQPLKVGDRVYVHSLKVDGNVQVIAQDTVEVEIGKMRVKVSTADISRSKTKEKKINAEIFDVSSTQVPASSMKSPGLECHLRGMRVDDALVELERYLEKAYAAGLPYVRIVHGKGTGTIRQVVREYLNTSSYVERWELALRTEGGEGVTVAYLKNT
ncbi:MAG: endonuclease MutS2 [Anaerolineaceae bacterium]|jgi:DNA mismatch repair protein MutS2|nr:MAG: endonuclease MutS2 [Anaerolineaceae bacterium]